MDACLDKLHMPLSEQLPDIVNDPLTMPASEQPIQPQGKEVCISGHVETSIRLPAYSHIPSPPIDIIVVDRQPCRPIVAGTDIYAGGLLVGTVVDIIENDGVEVMFRLGNRIYKNLPARLLVRREWTGLPTTIITANQDRPQPRTCIGHLCLLMRHIMSST